MEYRFIIIIIINSLQNILRFSKHLLIARCRCSYNDVDVDAVVAASLKRLHNNNECCPPPDAI